MEDFVIRKQLNVNVQKDLEASNVKMVEYEKNLYILISIIKEKV